MRGLLIAAVIATVVWAPWEFDAGIGIAHHRVAPIWSPPYNSSLRVEILAAEWVAIGGIWAIMAWGRKPKKEAQLDNEGNAVN